jgi:lipoprotein NlpD
MTPIFHFRPLVLALAALMLSACTTSVRVPAPVEDRSTSARPTSQPRVTPPQVVSPAPTVSQGQDAPVKPGNENAGTPGYYTVQRGDTLTRIGLDHGQGWRDLVRWNNLANPDVIEVGQVLRVAPPGASVETSGVVVRPVQPTGPNAATTQDKEEAAKELANKPNVASNGMQFIWPTQGKVVTKFDASNKGIEIAGKKGDPVLAAEAGKVAYVGESLRGYGKLILIKHNGYLTAYGHNDKFLVKEDQTVTKGQKIAEMGNTDADGFKLKFEIRDTAGKALNPVSLLPQR